MGWEERHEETNAPFSIIVWVMLGFFAFVLTTSIFFQFYVRPHTQPFVSPSAPLRPMATEKVEAEQRAAYELERAKAQSIRRGSNEADENEVDGEAEASAAPLPATE